MKRLLPGKSITALLVSALVIISGSILSKTISGRNILSAQKNEATGPVEQIISNSFAQKSSQASGKDSDNDGLRDWEESLWGTDPQKEDSDEDGTNDGEEVANGRNPSIKGPGDELVERKKDLNDDEEIKNLLEAKTATEAVGFNLISNFLKVNQYGIKTTSGNSDIINFIGESSVNSGESFIQDSLRESIVQSNNLVPQSKDNLKKYGNEIGRVLKETPERLASMISKASLIDSQLALGEEEIIIIKSWVEETLTNLGSIEVPLDIIEQHRNLVSSYSILLTSLSIVLDVNRDPIGSVLASRYIEDSEKKYRESLDSLRDIMRLENIEYNSIEPGYFITK